MSQLTGLACIRCGVSFNIEPRFDGCPECRNRAPANLTPRYDLDAAARTLSIESLGDRPLDMRRYRELLPPDVQDAPTLGEGETPLLHCERYGRRLGLDRLFLKDESRNPSGSFKDRLAFAAMAMAKRFDVKAVGVSSTGNAGAAAAAYAARAGLPCIVLTVQGAASDIVTQMQAYGAMVVATRTKADRWKLLQTGVAEWGWYPTSPYFGPPVGSNPYGVDGYKTLAYEVCEQMDWEAPDWCVLPVAYGDALFGMWKGFGELARLGVIRKRPRMVAAEMAGCLAAALASGEDAIPEIPAPTPYGGRVHQRQPEHLSGAASTARLRWDRGVGAERRVAGPATGPGYGRGHLRRAVVPRRACGSRPPVQGRANPRKRHCRRGEYRQRPQGHRRHRRGRTGDSHRGRRHRPIPGNPARCLRLPGGDVKPRKRHSREGGNPPAGWGENRNEADGDP